MSISITDLPPRMRQQAIRKLAEEEKEKKDDTHNTLLYTNQKEGNSKYKAHKTTVVLPTGEEHTFDSAKEARVYNELLIRLKAGEITDLRIQVPYELIKAQRKSNGKLERNVKYVADFVFKEDGKERVVDAKGYRKGGAYAIFVIKRKLMLWVYGIEVEEV